MIIDFTVENFRSIKEAVTLSAVAQSRGSGQAARGTRRLDIMPDDEIAPALRVEGRDIELLPVLAIFGANASGKSNVVMALDRLLFLMKHGAGDARTLAQAVAPFRLDAAFAEAPTRFELRVALEGTIYTYRLWLDQRRILLERLDHMPPPPKRNRLLFERRWDEGSSQYICKHGADFSGPHLLLEGSFEDYEPFISFLVQRLRIKVTDALARWLRFRWSGVSLGYEEFDQQMASLWGHALPGARAKVSEIIRRFDTGIADIDIKQAAGRSGEDQNGDYDVVVWHDTNGGRISWLLDEESTGTRRLFALASRTVYAFAYQSLVLVDELGSNIHPHVTRAIVRLFQDAKTNPKRAQLIFTSHDNTLQRGHLLRRDQIWFTQKRGDGSTDLYPLSDFKVRNDLAIDKAYLDGRFGAVPILPSEEDLIPIEETARQ